MNKRAQTRFPLHDLIADRWSPRGFDQRPIEPQVLGSLLEAARWAASCFNEQPWRFVVAPRSDSESFDRLLGCLGEGNQTWARNAGLLMLSVARSNFSRNDRPNRHAWHDVGLAVGNLSAQATALGLGVHQMAGFDRELAREQLGLPAGFEPVAMIAVGYPADPESLPPELAERERAPRSRRPLEEITFAGHWDKAWDPPA